jgi:zinc/manganese transport system ATP-binding protein
MPDSAAPLIELDRATIRLGSRLVLDRASLAIGAGEFIALLGPNGAGKTTLLRALLGLIPPASGAIRIAGHPARPGAADIGYLPQSADLAAAAWLTGRHFVGAAWQGQRWGLPTLPRAAHAAIDRALHQARATHLGARRLGSLSGGERQRLRLAQALLHPPRLLLLDEPLASLDPAQQHATVDLAASLHRDTGMTILFAAHELTPLLHAASRVLYLGAGHATIGTADEVITSETLSRLYEAPIEVVRTHGQILVLSKGRVIDRPCRH